VDNLSIGPLVADVPTNPIGGAGNKNADPGRIRDAAQQFEALLLGQMLRSVRESGANWLSTGEDSTGDSATDFAEQQFAAAMAQQGGLGLATVIADGLKRG
jgi:peptidoglycan hydrolase FlgJ